MTEDNIKELLKTNSDGRLVHREGSKIEFKENFNFNSMNYYSKTMASFANRKGGIIIFGVTDSPREAIGMKNKNFEETDSEKITNFLNNHFSPEIVWHTFQLTIEGRCYGVIITEEAWNKPVICIRNSNKNITVEGDIYYRYRARSEKIKYPELRNLLDDNMMKERKFWAAHIEKIAMIGPDNISLIDLKHGEITGDNNEKLIIDQNIIEKIKFIKRGHFVEEKGAPALRLIGDISGARLVSPNFDFEEDFFTTKELARKLDLLSSKGSTNYMSAVINHYQIKNNEQFYKSNRGQNLYTKSCLDFLKEKGITLEMAKCFARKKADSP